MPTQIDSRATYTVEQNNILFSIFCFHDLLSKPQIHYWRYFDLACQYLCKKILTETDIIIADSLLLRLCLCSRTEQLFCQN